MYILLNLLVFYPFICCSTGNLNVTNHSEFGSKDSFDSSFYTVVTNPIHTLALLLRNYMNVQNETNLTNITTNISTIENFIIHIYNGTDLSTPVESDLLSNRTDIKLEFNTNLLNNNNNTDITSIIYDNNSNITYYSIENSYNNSNTKTNVTKTLEEMFESQNNSIIYLNQQNQSIESTNNNSLFTTIIPAMPGIPVFLHPPEFKIHDPDEGPIDPFHHPSNDTDEPYFPSTQYPDQEFIYMKRPAFVAEKGSLEEKYKDLLVDTNEDDVTLPPGFDDMSDNFTNTNESAIQLYTEISTTIKPNLTAVYPLPAPPMPLPYPYGYPYPYAYNPYLIYPPFVPQFGGYGRQRQSSPYLGPPPFPGAYFPQYFGKQFNNEKIETINEQSVTTEELSTTTTEDPGYKLLPESFAQFGAKIARVSLDEKQDKQLGGGDGFGDTLEDMGPLELKNETTTSNPNATKEIKFEINPKNDQTIDENSNPENNSDSEDQNLFNNMYNSPMNSRNYFSNLNNFYNPYNPWNRFNPYFNPIYNQNFDSNRMNDMSKMNKEIGFNIRSDEDNQSIDSLTGIKRRRDKNSSKKKLNSSPRIRDNRRRGKSSTNTNNKKKSKKTKLTSNRRLRNRNNNHKIMNKRLKKKNRRIHSNNNNKEFSDNKSRHTNQVSNIYLPLNLSESSTNILRNRLLGEMSAIPMATTETTDLLMNSEDKNWKLYSSNSKSLISSNNRNKTIINNQMYGKTNRDNREYSVRNESIVDNKNIRHEMSRVGQMIARKLNSGSTETIVPINGSDGRQLAQTSKPKFLMRAKIKSVDKLRPDLMTGIKWWTLAQPSYCTFPIFVVNDCPNRKLVKRWSYSSTEQRCYLYEDYCSHIKANSFESSQECFRKCYRIGKH